jgi:hypothetical protein
MAGMRRFSVRQGAGGFFQSIAGKEKRDSIISEIALEAITIPAVVSGNVPSRAGGK